MAKKKGKKGSSDPRKLGKTHLASLSSLVSSYRPEQIGGTYVKETLPELVKQVSLQQKPLTKLIEAQSVLDRARFAPLSSEDRKARGAAFTKWLSANAPNSLLGDRFDFTWNVAEGSGVVARRDMKAQEAFIRIPRKVMMTSTQAIASDLGKYLKSDQMFGTMPNLMLAIFLMFESLNPDSFWKPYIDVLPRDFNLPLFFSTEELAHLEGSPTYYDVLKTQKQTLRQYVLTHKLLGAKASHLKLPPFTFRDFRWAVGVLMTRQNSIPAKSDPKLQVLTLIPGWDFCNFRDGQLTTHFNDDLDASESFTMGPVKAGQQIFIYYGNRPNSKLFLFSGFVAKDHKTDYVEVLFYGDTKADENDPIRKIKKMTLANRRMRETAQAFRVSASTGEPSSACMSWLRIKCMDKKEAGAVLKLKTALVDRISAQNETAAYALLKTNIARAIAAYPTSLEDDEKTLAGDTLSARARVAVELRLNEKRALLKCQKLVAERAAKVAGAAGDGAAV